MIIYNIDEFVINTCAMYTGNFTPPRSEQDPGAITPGPTDGSIRLSLYPSIKLSITTSAPIDGVIRLPLNVLFGITDISVSAPNDAEFPVELIIKPNIIPKGSCEYQFNSLNGIELERVFNILNTMNFDFDKDFSIINSLTESFELVFDIRNKLLSYNEVEKDFSIRNRILSDTSSEVYNGFYFSKIHGMES
jgi:hypothetical protein